MRPTSTAPRAVIYALGGGRGHATRSARLAGWFETGWEVHLIWPSRLRGFLCTHPVHHLDAAEEVAPLLRQLKPDLLLVDTFPRGLMGELVPPCPAWLIGRWLKPAYAARPEVQASLDNYEAILSVELTPWDRGHHLGPVVGPPAPSGSGRGIVWLGSGPVEEQRRVCQFLSKEVTVAAPDLQQPRADLPTLLAGADLVISAAGYNAYHEIVQSGRPVIFWPQDRRYDQQHIRATGKLGPAPRGWHRCVHDLAGLKLALSQWREEKPKPAEPLPLARPDAFQTHLARFLGASLNGRISLASNRPQT